MESGRAFAVPKSPWTNLGQLLRFFGPLMLLAEGLLAQSPKAQPTRPAGLFLPKAKALAAHGDCRLCHIAHTAMQVGKTPNRKGPKTPQQSEMDAMCLGCHQGTPNPGTDQGASKLAAWAGSGSSHIDGPFLERAQIYARVVDLGLRRKPVLRPQCIGCHDMHAKDRPANLLATAFDGQGKVLKVKPTTVAQTCFACHAGPEAARLPRGEADLGALFLQGGASAHRPGAQGTARQELPSLRAGLFNGTLDCTSCHGNPDPTGPKGPHSSPYPHLLKASYGREGDGASIGNRSDDLCLTCHDRTSILGNQSFPLHAQHIAGFTPASKLVSPGGRRPAQRPTPGPKAPWAGMPAGMASTGMGQPTACATCHNPHGSSQNPALIAFDKNVVSRSSVGTIAFQRAGWGHGTCTLSCHGYDHVQTRY